MQSGLNKDIKISERDLLFEKIVRKIFDTKDIDEIKNYIITIVGKELNASRCLIAEYDFENNNQLNIKNEYLNSPEIKSFKTSVRKSKITDESLDTGLIIYDSDEYLKANNFDAESIEAHKLRDYNVQSGFSVPIYHNDKCFGIIILHYDKSYAFNNKDIYFVKILAGHIGIALNQFILYETVKKQAEQEATLRKITQTIRSSLDLDETLKIICTEISKLFEVEKVLIVGFSEDANIINTLRYQYVLNNTVKHDWFKLSNKLHEYWKKIIAENNGTVVINNMAESNTPDSLKKIYEKLGTKSLLSVSLRGESKEWGAINLHKISTYKNWTEDEINLLKAISDQIYIAINQAELYKTVQETAKKEKMLAEIMSVTKSNLKIDEIFVIICSLLSNFYDANKIIILNLDKEGNKLNILKECSKKNKISHDLSIKSKKYLYGKISENKNLVINDIEKADNPQYFLKELKTIDIKALIMVPIFININETGAIFILDNKKNNWQQKDIHFLSRVAIYISIAIKEANIYNQSEFMSNVSHELKTPISIIDGYAGALLNLENPDCETANQFLHIIKNNVKRLNKLIDNLLFISTIDKKLDYKNVVFEKLKVIDLIENSVQLCEEKIKSKNIRIEKNIENIFIKKANIILLQQLIINLLINAVNYSEGSSLIRINAIKNGKKILISIEDRGCGIKKEHLQNIFERFYRVDKSRNRETGGTGLGLSISKLISEIHGGDITVESVFGQGSTFTLHLPE